MEDKIIDQILEILSLMNSYVPTTPQPANPQLPLIRTKLLHLQANRKTSSSKFKISFVNISEITKEISSIKLK